MCDERSGKQWQATIQREMWTLICQDNPLYSTICGTIFWRGVGEERLAFALADHLQVLLTLLVLLWVKKKESAFIFGVGFFYLSHSIESTVFPLQLIHEHRNYIGSFGLLFGICALVVNHSGVLRSGAEAGRRWGLLAVAVAYALLLASVCFGRASLWGKGVEGALIETQHHPQSASSFCELGRQYAVLADQVDDEADKEELMVFAKQGFQRCYELDDNYVHGLFALLILDARTGKPPSPERMDQLTKKYSIHK